MAKETIEDVIKNENQDIKFEIRAKKFEEEMTPISKKWGIAPNANLVSNNQAIIAQAVLVDLWASPPSKPE